jgi:hypothetical protein
LGGPKAKLCSAEAVSRIRDSTVAAVQVNHRLRCDRNATIIMIIIIIDSAALRVAEGERSRVHYYRKLTSDQISGQ